MKHVHAIIIRVHEASQRIRMSPAFALDPERRMLQVGDRLTHIPPTTPTDLDFRPLQPKASSTLLSRHLDTSADAVSGLAQLLSYHSVATVNSHSGLTWLELLVLSIASSSTPAAIVQTHTANPAKRIASLLRKFISKAKAFVKFAYAAGAQNLFRCSHQPPNRLEAYGYINYNIHVCILTFMQMYGLRSIKLCYAFSNHSHHHNSASWRTTSYQSKYESLLVSLHFDALLN